MGMGICTKTNGFKAVTIIVILFLALNVLFNYFSSKDDGSLSFSKLNYKRISVSSWHDSNKSADPFVSFNNSEQKISLLEFNNTDSNDLSISNSDGKVYTHSTQAINPNNLLPKCNTPKPSADGPFKPNITLESLDIVQQRLSSTVMMGGWYRPKNCTAQFRVAIIVPFRDRYAHLSIFLKNLHPFLMRQNLEYRIFVIEQTNGKLFNRAALMNIGYLEALKMSPWDCFIFHDVDLLPLDERNIYNCPNQPRHMSVAIDVFGYRLPYSSIFGGVSAMTRQHFAKVNGFSNSFWGWGGEDDDMSNRLKHANLYISRYPINIARYMMLTHQKERANPKRNSIGGTGKCVSTSHSICVVILNLGVDATNTYRHNTRTKTLNWPTTKDRYENLVNGVNKFDMDGLNSIKYDIYSFKEYPLFTWYLAELKMSDQR